MRLIVPVALLAGCPPGKPGVDLPTPSGELTAALVVPALEGGPRDVRVLRATGTRLYVGDAAGLFVYDVADPSQPILLVHIDGAVDDIALVGTVAITMAVAAGARLRAYELADPFVPVVLADVAGTTLTFGGIAARDDLVWHAVGSNPPSQLFTGPDLAGACDGPDNERGAMDVWMDDRFVYETVHFDDYAGDGFDGNGAYGLISYRVEATGGCPRASLLDVFFFATHANNRSAFERASASDLQVAPLAGDLFATGEQRLRWLAVDANGRFSERDAVDIPDALQLAIDAAGPCGPVVAVTNGRLVLACTRDGLSIATEVATPGIARAIIALGDGQTLFVGDDRVGLALVSYGVP